MTYAYIDSSRGSAFEQYGARPNNLCCYSVENAVADLGLEKGGSQ